MEPLVTPGADIVAATVGLVVVLDLLKPKKKGK